jgi:hypothetical protein
MVYYAAPSKFKEEITVSESNLSAHSTEFSAGNARPQRPLRIALFGFGTVASSVARILVDSAPEGLELTHVYVRSVAKRRAE